MEEINQIINRVPAWKGAHDIHIERIAGLTNANYRITVDGECFVLRISGQNTERLGINRHHEVAALQVATQAGISPQVVAFLLPEGHLVTRWVEGRHWEAAEFRTPDNVRLLTEIAQRIHALPPNGAFFSPFQKVAAYQKIAADFMVPFPPGFDGFLETMYTVQTDQEHDPSGWRRFCHNDLVSVNYLFIDETRSIQVLDWEFAGLGDIYYDLATIVYTHDSDGPIPAELEEVMLACYFGETTAFQHKRLRGMKYMLMLFTGMWGLAQHGMQQVGLIPPVEGFDYQEFAHYLFTHDILELHKQYHRFVKFV